MEEIKTISINDKNYPERLKKIQDPPKVVYFRGEIFSKEDCFAIVGTRMCSHYGKQTTQEITTDLAEAGLVIVSGLAPGIDTICHQTSVEMKKRTIAVLGTGIDEKTIYPRSNLKLSRQILENNGCLISEYPPGTRGTKFTFPQRNRIISGLSLGVLVVEAKQKSGALITASFAKKQGGKLFAVPGPIHSSNSKGPNRLIKEGAKLTESASDILKELNIISLNLHFKKEPDGENEEEKIILGVIKEQALDIDKIIEKTNLPAQKIASALAILEIKDKVRNLGRNIYALAR